MRVCPLCGARYTGEARFCSHDGEPTVPLPPSDSGDPLLGRVVDGRYRIDGVIGEGGMGVVYGVTHVSLGKRFALKVLRRDYARDETVVARFVREARAASSIGHPSIVDIHDFGRLPDESTYFVMELLEGETLTARIRRGALRPDEALHVTRQIASALSAAHASGIVHRDLKPDNVHLVQRGENPIAVKVLDFGIAKVGGAHGKLTRTGTVFGTPYYMSPEQAAGQSVDGRTDVYALGVILFEMLTGRVPFDGDTFMGILSKQMFEAPPSLVAAGIDPQLAEAVARALEKRPEERTASMEALVDDLEAALAGETLAPRPSHRGTAPSPAAAGPAKPPRSRPSPLVFGGLALAGFGLMAGAAALWLTSRDAAPSSTPGPGPEVPRFAGTADAAGTPAADPAPTPRPNATPALQAAPPPVLLDSEPAGASVLEHGALIGTTPLVLPRPAADATRELELQLEAHAPRSVRISADSATHVQVNLETQRRRGRPWRVAPAAPREAAPAGSRAPRPPPQSEVLDPWGN